LVHSAAGGCGLFGLGICNALGAVPIATVGSPTKVSAILERFPDMDPETIIVRERKRFGDQVEAAATAAGSTDGTCDVVMDAVMGDFFKGGWSRLGARREVRGVRRRGFDPSRRPRLERIRVAQAWVEVRQSADGGPDELTGR
jgi:NADPH:quinone reductase-like Zn-dependent oxidoreductase